MFYLIKTPWWLKKMYPSLVWDVPAEDKTLYLTFDDGPHETATPYVLNQLNQHNAKATFFCIGKNVAAYPGIYAQMLAEGHTAGNHTYNHLNGWKTGSEKYLENVAQAAEYIHSGLFRPPYGRVTRQQAMLLQTQPNHFKVIMWDVLSGDFDIALSQEGCLQNVMKHAKPGAIVVFHDSAKAYERMSYALPRVLEHYSNLGYIFKALI